MTHADRAVVIDAVKKLLDMNKGENNFRLASMVYNKIIKIVLEREKAIWKALDVLDNSNTNQH